MTNEGELFPRERIVWGAGVPAIAFHGLADPSKPLVVLIPGGGHLGRIYYGHPEARPGDFLIHHLAKSGFSTLALSYPSAHPAIGHPLPEMTITQWSDAIAAIIADHVAATALPARAIVIGWSLAGRVARNLALALKSRKIELDLFVGLSAVIPMPGFGVLGPSALKLAPTGLLDGSSEESPILESREKHLAVIDRINGRTVLPRSAYRRLYVTDSPIGFRGEAERYDGRGLIHDIGAAVADQGSFDFANYPLCATISACDPADAVHALTDAVSWGLVNAKALFAQRVKPWLTMHEPSIENWAGLRALFEALPGRLSRYVEGGHLFFVGERGAAATARHLRDLMREATTVRSELAELLRG